MRSAVVLALVVVLALAAIPAQASGNKMSPVDRLLAKQEVIETVNRLFILTDQREWAALKRIFAPQVHFDMTSLGAEKPETLNPEQITSAWEKGLKHLEAIHHQAGNYLVDISPKGATVFCYGIASHYLTNPSGKNVRIFVGSYNLHLIKAGKDWQIDAFKFTLKYLDGNPNLEGK